ncbi:hypothetical protein QNO08_13470 [Arthrobacter sp. zg-Y820]|uniref:hypothetical protein n=1 Tax=unclassified Arthrobacter TaxID=235627 RepID=UPI001E5156FB|nr:MULTISPECIES: hypothetical protein [unclassified Arthrobacter]MCC9195882.1 hypothetical protein [Arthrobacter sp. zg-Y820]MDK1278742.1 hypothetical protein [Arthrobacter sp. zg.Y820]WIB08835.1 hypothetical protein QNO08_13470 [Arthrobacter sp. zg-Y820]
MKRKRIVVALVLVSVSVPAAGCRNDSASPATPATVDPADSVTHSYSTDDPGAEYWTPERMESAVPEMPTED